MHPHSSNDIALPVSRRANERLRDEEIEFSICTLVTDHALYDTMMKSFVRKGFVEPRCEYLHVDNTNGNSLDAYAAFNVFLRAARGKYVVVCHQDVELIEDDIAVLTARLEELTRLDPDWAVVGNSGGKFLDHRLARRITDPYGVDQNVGPFPHRVTAVDENFVVVRADANLGLSGNLRGFHLYATDLSIIASVMGYTAYVIDFHLHHASSGKVRRREDLREGELHFEDIRTSIRRKYARAFSPAWISAPVTKIFIFPDLTWNGLANLKVALRLLLLQMSWAAAVARGSVKSWFKGALRPISSR